MGRPTAILCVAAAALGAVGCGGSIQVSKDDTSAYKGAVLFNQRCSGCHTLDVVGAEGSATLRTDRERVDGPNFNQRKECAANVLYAIANGGYSGAIMPANVVVGSDAEAIADFLSKYSGKGG